MISKKLFLSIAILLLSVNLWAEKDTSTEQDLHQFIDFVAQKTNKLMIYDSSVLGRKVFLSNFKWETPKELFRVFLSVLEHNGYILEVVGEGAKEVLKIKRNIQGPWTATPVYTSEEELNNIANKDEFITMVIKLKHVSATEVQSPLRALRMVNPQGGNLVGLEDSQTILISDFANNVIRVYKVIKLLDVPRASEEITVSAEQSKLSLEGQTIPIYIPKKAEVYAFFKAEQNASLTVTNKEGMVITQMDPSSKEVEQWLTPYIKKSPALNFELQLMSKSPLKLGDNTRLSITIVVVPEGKNESKREVWSLILDRPLKREKNIQFVLRFEES